MLLSESSPKNDYESAKDAHNLFPDAFSLSEKQTAEEKEDPKLVRYGKYVFRYNDTVYSDEERRIPGKDIVEWIKRNDPEDVLIYLSTEGIYSNLVDVDNKDHYREIQLNWNTGHGKYETTENHLEPEN